MERRPQSNLKISASHALVVQPLLQLHTHSLRAVLLLLHGKILLVAAPSILVLQLKQMLTMLLL
jgi:hypothetical protein